MSSVASDDSFYDLMSDDLVMNLGKLIQYYYVTSAIVKWIKSSEKYVFLPRGI